MPSPTSDPKLSLNLGLNLTANKGDLETQIRNLTRDLSADIGIKIDPKALQILNDFAQSFKSLNELLAEQNKTMKDVAGMAQQLGQAGTKAWDDQANAMKQANEQANQFLTKLKQVEDMQGTKLTQLTYNMGGRTGETQVVSQGRNINESAYIIDNEAKAKAQKAVAEYQKWAQEQIQNVQNSGLASNAVVNEMKMSMEGIDAQYSNWNEKLKAGQTIIKDYAGQVESLQSAITKTSELLNAMLGEHPNETAIKGLLDDLTKLQVMKTDNFKEQLVQITDQAKLLDDQLIRSAESASFLQVKWNDRLANIDTSGFSPEQLSQYNAINQAVSDFNTTSSKVAQQAIDYNVKNMENLSSAIEKDTVSLQKFNYELENMNADLGKLKSNPWADQSKIMDVQGVLNNPQAFNPNSGSVEVQRMRDQIRAIADDAKFSEKSFSDSMEQMIEKTKMFVDLRIMSAQQAQKELAKTYKDNLDAFKVMTDDQVKMIKAIADMQAKANEHPMNGIGDGYRFKGYAFNPMDLTRAMVGFEAFQGMMGLGQDFVQIQQSAAGVQQVLGASAENQGQLNQMVQQFIGISAQYGASVTDVLDSAKLWGRQYKDINEVMNLTNEATLLSVVDNLKVADANKAVESSMNAMGMATGNANEALASASKLVDSWSAVSHEASVSAGDLTGGFERSAAAAKQAGLNVDQLNALIAVGVRNTGRSGQVIGNMWKSVLANLEAGTPKVKQAVEALGVKYDPNNVFQMILDISKSAQNSTPEMSKYFEAIAGGKYQYDSLRASISNTSAIMQAYQDSQASTGAGAVLAQTQMHTLGAEIQRLKDNIQQMMYSSSQGGVTSIFKDIVVAVNDLVVGLNNMPTGLARILEVVAGLGALGMILNKVNSIAGGTAGTFIKMGQDIVGGYRWMTGKLTGTISESEAIQAKYLAQLDRQSLSAKTNTQAINLQTRALTAQNGQLSANTADTTANTEAQIANAEARGANAEASNAEKVAQEGQAIDALTTKTKGATQAISETGVVAGEATGAIDGLAEAGTVAGAGLAEGAGATMGFAGLLETLGPATGGVTALLGLLVAGIGTYALVSGRAKQKTDEMTQALKQQQDQIQNAYQQNPAQINNLVSQYGNLESKTNGGTTGSSSDIQQYYDVTQQLAGLMPSVIDYIDTEGKYHLMNSNAIKKEIDSINQLNQVQVQQQDGMKDLIDQYDQTIGKIKDLQDAQKNGTSQATQSAPLQNLPDASFYQPTQDQLAQSEFSGGMTVNKVPLSPEQQANDQLQIEQYNARTAQIKKAMHDRASAYIQGIMEQRGSVSNDNLSIMDQIVSLTDWHKAGNGGATLEESSQAIVDAIQALNNVAGSGTGTIAQYKTIFEQLAPQLGLTKDQVASLSSAMQTLHEQSQQSTVDWSGLSDSINTILTGNQTLYQAQQELDSQGSLSQQTIVALTKAYGVDFVNAMNDGTSAVKRFLDQQVKGSTDSLEATRKAVAGQIEAIKAEIDAMEAEQQMAQKGILQQQLKQQLANGDTADARLTAQTIQYYENGTLDGYSKDADYQNTKKRLADLQSEYDFLGNEIASVNNGAQDATGKTKAKTDEYAIALDDVNTALDKQKAYVQGLDNTSSAYRAGLQKEIDLLNQKAKLLNQDINSKGGGSSSSGSVVAGTSTQDLAQSVANALGWNVNTVLSQWIEETGNFSSNVFNKDNNFAGIKYYQGLSGATRGSKASDGGYYAHWDSPEAGAQGYVDFVNQNSYYWGVKNHSTANGQIAELAKHWATDPSYASKLESIAGQLSSGGYNVNSINTSGGSSKASSLQQQLVQVQQQIQQLNDQIVESRVKELDNLVSGRNSNIITRWKQISQTYSDGSKQQIDALKNLAYWQNNSEYWVEQQMQYISKEVASDKISEAEKEKLRQSYERLDTQLNQLRLDEADTRFSIVTNELKAQDDAVKGLTKSVNIAKQTMSDWGANTSEYQGAFSTYIQDVSQLAQHDIDQMNYINQQLTTNTGLTQAQQDQLKQQFQQYENDFQAQQNNILQIKKNIANEIVNAEKSAIQQQMKLMDQQHTNAINKLNDEKNVYDKLIDVQIQAIQTKERNQSYQEQLTKDERDAQKIRNQLDALSVDSSAEAMSKKADLSQQLADLQQKIADEQIKHQDELTTQTLNDQKKSYDDQNKVQQDALNTQYNNAKKTLQNILDDTAYWDNQVTQIMEGNFTEASSNLNGLMQDLQNNTNTTSGNFQGMASTIQATMGQAGQSIQSGLIANLQIALGLMQQIGSIGGLGNTPSLGNPTTPVNINAPVPSGTGSSGSSSSSGGSSGGSNPYFHNGYDPNKMPLVKQGSNNSYVKTLQTLLNDHFGYRLKVDGIFGTATLTAVEDFQKKHGLSVDGLVGANTWRAVDTFDTGGYTGNNVPASGALAVLHGKELVLNAKDTQNILEAVKLMRNFGISELIAGSQNLVSQALSGITKLVTSGLRSKADEKPSTVTINMPVKIDSLSGDEKGARDFFDNISAQLKRKGVILK